MIFRSIFRYGRSEGTPSEEGLALDAQAILAYTRSRKEVDPAKIFLIGRSLGGAVAVQLAHNMPEQVSG